MTTAQAEARAVVALLAEEMRSGLTGVTPGPWILIPAIPYDGDDDGLEGAFVEPAGIEGSDGNPVCIFGSALGSGSLFENERDHEHINRCHPDNIRALLDDRDAIAGQNAELRAEIAALKKEAADVVRPFAKIADGEPDNAVFHTGHKVFKAARSFLDKWEGEMVEPRLIEANWNTSGVQYHEYTCVECGKLDRNTYCEPHRTNMLNRRLCWHCNYWRDFEARLERDHTSMTIIDGHVYGPGSRTSGSFRGMAGRRFDIEYIPPSIYAGKRVTTFDLWSGSTLPEHLQKRFPDTAKFLGGAEKCSLDGEITTCWNPSDHSTDPYPLPCVIGIK